MHESEHRCPICFKLEQLNRAANSCAGSTTSMRCGTTAMRNDQLHDERARRVSGSQKRRILSSWVPDECVCSASNRSNSPTDLGA